MGPAEPGYIPVVMSEHAPLARRYTDKEVSRILRRATELQRGEPGAPNPSGLTLAELEEVALEAGIDPRYLKRAAAEIESGSAASLGEKLVGAPLSFVIERTVAGELPPSEFEALVPELQAATLGQGSASAVGKTLTWTSRSDSTSSSQQVLITSREGHTTIRIEERFTGMAGGLFGGFLGGIGGGLGLGAGGALAGVLGSVAVGIALPVVAIGGAYYAARSLFAGHVRKRRRKMEELMDRLLRHVEELAVRPRLGEDGPSALPPSAGRDAGRSG